MVGVRLQPAVRRRVEAWAKQSGLKFSDAVRVLLDIGLEHAPDVFAEKKGK
jgi:antitoxin component of RelBE/YafQ-DinJ toxin-antitoxin module